MLCAQAYETYRAECPNAINEALLHDIKALAFLCALCGSAVDFLFKRNMPEIQAEIG
jgi:hypothetical protein